jgi:Tol biopolymer transport system component
MFPSLVRAGAALVALAAMASHSDAQSARPGTAKARPSKQYTIEQFMNVTGVRGAGFSADESRFLFSSNRTGIWNTYSIPVGGGEWVPITASTVDSTYAVSYFPTDDRVLFTRDQGGNELNHLYVKMLDGQEKDLTPGEKLKAQFAGWSGDRTSFHVSTNERDPRFFDLYRYDAKTLERAVVFKNDLGYMPSGISRDGKWVALVKPNTTNDTDLYLWSEASGEARHITPHTGEATYYPATFDPASTYFY